MENAGLFLKTLYDLNLNLKLVISGSSSLEIRAKVAEYFTGRKVSFSVRPFSFSEYLKANDVDYAERVAEWKSEEELIYLNNIFGKSLQVHCEKYLTWGGYPKVALTKAFSEKDVLLGELYKTYVEKDVSYFFGIRDTISFNKFVLTLSYQNGALFNIQSMSRDLGVYRDKLFTYLSILENTFVIKQVIPFFKNKAKEISKMPKVYFQDSGIRNYSVRDLGNFPRGDIGCLSEGFCLSEIINQGCDAKFWRTQAGAEVDFIIQGKNPLPIEVKYTGFKQAKIERGLANFITQYKVYRGIVITRDFAAKKEMKGAEIWFVPIYLISGIKNLIM